MDDAEERAQMILVTAMERMSSEVTAERTVTAVKLTDDEMKGRIIGKEGRNIQSLQRETGVDILVDDTPGMVILSSFDPIRRQVPRLSLEMLMKDGRIHPARIEEVVAKAKKQIDKEVKQAGEDAAREVGARERRIDDERLIRLQIDAHAHDQPCIFFEKFLSALFVHALLLFPKP